MCLIKEIERILRNKRFKYNILPGKNVLGKYKKIAIYGKLRNHSIVIYDKKVRDNFEEYNVFIYSHVYSKRHLLGYFKIRERNKILAIIRNKIK